MSKDTLVVIPTHNGKKMVQRFLEAQPHTNRILVVDTFSSDPDHIQYLLSLPGKYPMVSVTQTPFKGYDTGAFLWAYWKFQAENYLFLQDSIFPREENYVSLFEDAMPELGAVAWTGFAPNIWDSADQITHTHFLYGQEPPPRGIFGPVFMTNRKSLNLLRDKGLLPSYPVHKVAAQALERGWPMCFARAGMPVRYLVDDFDPQAMSMGMFPIFTKDFPTRR